MRQNIKHVFLVISKRLGLFRIARFVTRRALRILCYHGFALSDESEFLPGLFIQPETFRTRMQHVADEGYPVLGLDEASTRLRADSLPDNAVVITVDDGFYSFFDRAWPVLRSQGFPATVYVTSYYAAKRRPVFRLAVQYMFWKTQEKSLDTAELGLPLAATLALTTEQEKNRAMWDIIDFSEVELEECARGSVASKLGERLHVDYGRLEAERRLSLLTAEEIGILSTGGADIQLHTHRHHLPEQQRLVEREIAQNREFLEPLTGKKLRHLCYPSGTWSINHWPWLEALGIASATTCDNGLNYASTPHLALRRFLDSEAISQMEFEAELSGFLELLRRGRAMFAGEKAA